MASDSSQPWKFIIGIKDAEGKITVHIPAVTDGHEITLCGEFEDAEDNYTQVDVPLHRRVNCYQCYQIWSACQSFKETWFAPAILATRASQRETK